MDTPNVNFSESVTTTTIRVSQNQITRTLKDALLSEFPWYSNRNIDITYKVNPVYSPTLEEVQIGHEITAEITLQSKHND